MRITTLSIMTALAFFSCANCKNATKDQKVNEATTALNDTTPASTQTSAVAQDKTETVTTPNSSPMKQNQDSATAKTSDNKYELVASFFSIGAGIDSDTQTKFDTFLSPFESKITIQKTPWGREGEVDYCIRLNRLTGAEQKDFIKKSRAILEKSKFVHINENSICRNKR